MEKCAESTTKIIATALVNYFGNVKKNAAIENRIKENIAILNQLKYSSDGFESYEVYRINFTIQKLYERREMLWK